MSISSKFPEIKSILSTQSRSENLDYLNSLLQSVQSEEDQHLLSTLFKEQGDLSTSDSLLSSLSHPKPRKASITFELSSSPESQAEFESFQSVLSSSPMTEGSLWHIVSKTWLASWENSLFKGSPAPGPISNADLIDTTEFFNDPRPHKAYTNLALKPDVQEKVHFEVISKAAYNFLVKKYGQDPTVLKRWCISLNDDGSGLHIEARLKPLQVLVIPTTQSSSVTVLISRVETLAHLKDKLVAAQAALARLDFRTWVLKANDKLQGVKGSAGAKGSQKIAVKGKLLLNEKTMIEECEIAENDLVVAEFKHSEDWILFNSDQICGFCKNSGNLKLCSICRLVKYCSRDCQVSDYHAHKEVCRKVEPREIGDGLVGLQNLGLTCFMNSALQCLMHSPGTRDYFLSGSFAQHLNTSNPLGTKNAALAKVFAELVRGYWSGQDAVLAPWSLKKVISKFSPQFIGYDQHDAHELLTFLLTGLHEDLNQVLKKPYVEKPENDGLNDEAASKLAWDWFLLRNRSFVVDLMYGQLKSSLKCPLCSRQSFTFDPFLTLSVNLPNGKRVGFKVRLVSKKFEMVKQEFLLFGNTTVCKVRDLIKAKFGMKNLVLFFYSGTKVQGICDDHKEVAEYFKKKLVAYECAEELKGVSIVSVYVNYSKGERFDSKFERLAFFKASDSVKKVNKYFKNHLPPGFKVYFVHHAHYSGFLYKNKDPCVLCSQLAGDKCALPNSNMTLGHISDGIANNSRISLEIVYEDLSSCSSICEAKKTEDISDNFILNDQLTLNNCISFSMNPETLDSDNEWFCPGCKTHVQASKSLHLYLLPRVLIVHLVRFRTRGMFSSKNTEFVDFPTCDLDLKDQVIGASPGKYDLFGVVNHYGGLGGGHYTAFVNNGQFWYCMDDSTITKVSEEKVVSSSAYILFYKLKS